MNPQAEIQIKKEKNNEGADVVPYCGNFVWTQFRTRLYKQLDPSVLKKHLFSWL